MTIWLPVVRAQLVETLPTLPDWSQVSVYDGEPLTTDAADVWCTVGYVEDDSSDAQFEKVQDSVDGMLGEVGSIRSELILVTGNGDLPGLQASGLGLLEQFGTYLEQNPELGVLPVSSTVFYGAESVPGSLHSGSTLRITWTVNYFARS